jgi:hypothetical protein
LIMNKLYCFLTVLFVGFSMSFSQEGCMDAAACNYDATAIVNNDLCIFDATDNTIRDEASYIAGTGFSIGAFQEEGPYTQAGYVLADQY